MLPTKATMKCVVQVKSTAPSLTSPNPHLSLGGPVFCVILVPTCAGMWQLFCILLPFFQQIYLQHRALCTPRASLGTDTLLLLHSNQPWDEQLEAFARNQWDWALDTNGANCVQLPLAGSSLCTQHLRDCSRSVLSPRGGNSPVL